MPELPDVEVYRQYLNSTALHQRIEHVHVASDSILSETTPQGLGQALRHRSFHSVERHGKYLFIDTDNKWLVMHFGMTGNIRYFQERQEIPDFTRLLFAFENGYRLAYIAPRKLGRIALSDSPQAWIKRHNLGPDALELTEDQFIRAAAQRRGSVKSWIMNQQRIAGIGNIYSDEILFQARVHPQHLLNNLDRRVLKRIYESTQAVIKDAINARADPERMPAGFLLPHRKQGEYCPACDTPLESVKAAGRTAWYCPNCQRL